MAKNIIIGLCMLIIVLLAAFVILSRIELKRVSDDNKRITSAYTLYTRETERKLNRIEGLAADSGRIITELRTELGEERTITQQLREEHRRDKERIERADKDNDEARAELLRLIARDGP